MRPRLIIAAQSGVVIGLLGLVLYQSRQLRDAQRHIAEVPSPVPEATGTTSARPVRLRLQQLPPIQIRNQTVDLDWRSVESDDYAVYVANLRRIGCPEETIGDIIRADVDKLFAARRRALKPSSKEWEFWRSTGSGDPMDEASKAAARERESALAELERERRQLLITLLGTAGQQAEFAELRSEVLDEPALQFLDSAKRESVATALARLYQAERERLSFASPEEGAQAMREAQEALDSALAALTPQEREQYEMGTSRIAYQLREELVGFDTSREEFETLYRLRREGADELAALSQGGEDPLREDKAEALAIEQEEKIRKALGDARFKDYLRARDPDYQTLHSLAVGHQVSADVANQVWDMRAAVESQTDRIRANPLLTVEQKVRALEAIRETTQASIVDVLGEPLLQEYQRNGGSWLSDLTAPVDLGESGMSIIEPPLPPGVAAIPAQVLTEPLP